jgi:hypothetical protein
MASQPTRPQWTTPRPRQDQKTRVIAHTLRYYYILHFLSRQMGSEKKCGCSTDLIVSVQLLFLYVMHLKASQNLHSNEEATLHQASKQEE